MLHFVQNWNASRPNNRNRDKTIEPNIMSNAELGEIIEKIDNILGDIAETFEGIVEYQGENLSIKWTRPQETGTQSRIKASTAAKPIDRLTVSPKDLKNSERQGLSKSLQARLIDLQSAISKITGTPLDILGGNIEANDILGWEICSVQDIKKILAENESPPDGYRVTEVSKGKYKRKEVPEVELQPGGRRRGML